MSTLKKFLLGLALFAGLAAAPTPAIADGTPVVDGYWSLSCGTGPSPCFVQYGSAIPVTGTVTPTNPTIGAAVPATANYVAGNKGGLLAGVLLDSDGYLQASLTNLTGTKAAGTAASNSLLTGCVYNATVVAPTTGQQVATQCGPNGGSLPAEMTLTGSASSATTLTNFTCVDTAGYGVMLVQFTSIGSGNTIRFQGANDAACANTIDIVSGLTSSTTTFNNFASTAFSPSTAALYQVPLASGGMRYVRINITTYGSGTVTAAATFKTASPPFTSQGVFGALQPANTTTTAGSGLVPTADLFVCDDTSPPAITENQYGPARQDCATHALHVDGACTLFAAIAVTAGNTTQIVALSGTTVIKVCNMHLSIATTGTFAILSGTGSNCATPANATGTMNLTAGSVDNFGDGTGVIYRGSAGGELCVTATTGNINGWVMYSQL